MRVTSLLRAVLNVTSLFVLGVRLEDDTLIIPVRPRWRKPRCGCCGRIAPGYDTRPKPRTWTSLPMGRMRVLLEYTLRRVQCPECGVRTEKVPWAEHQSKFTYDFEEMVAYQARASTRTALCEQLALSWHAAGRIIGTVIEHRLEQSRLDGLRRIGIDEFSYRKRHKYLTVVVNHDTGRVVWAAKGRGADTLGAFFDELGPERLAALETATIDMAGGYIKALTERAPHVKIVFDRFHVQKLANEAVDEVRRAIWRAVKGTEEGKAIKGTRFLLLSNPDNLSRRQRKLLADIQQLNRPLYRAYLLKETLVKALSYRQPWRAKLALKEWLAWASRSRLKPFVKLARTVRKHREGILAYVEERLTNGVVEGTNNKLRTIARKAYGFHSHKALVAMLFLCCGGIELDPPIPARAR